MRYIYSFKQRQYIQQQLDRNMVEIRSAEDELKLITKEQGYDLYVIITDLNVPRWHLVCPATWSG